MSVKWEQWERDLLEKERAFEVRPMRRRAPWGFWDLVFTLTVTVLVIAGLVKIWEGLQ